MRMDEYPFFIAELKQLCASLGKSYSDPLAQAYWRALKDIALDEIQANVERLLLNANAETKFPRPAQLRTSPLPRQQSALENDPSLKDALERNKRNWDEKLQNNPPLAKWHILSAYLARIDAEEEPETNFYEQRMQWAREVALRLVDQYGQSWCTHDPHCMHAASRLLGGKAIAR